MKQAHEQRVRDIVCVGASAGGVLALARLVSQLPFDFGAAVFVVLPNMRDSSSTLPALLGRYSVLPVAKAVNGAPIVRGCVRVGPHDRYLRLTSAGTVIAPPSLERGSRAHIDELFQSAASAFGSRVIGVVLTGGLPDGIVGLEAIRRGGGLVVVQSPTDAFASTMPLAAIAAGPVDHVVCLDELGPLLVELTRIPAGPLSPVGERTRLARDELVA